MCSGIGGYCPGGFRQKPDDSLDCLAVGFFWPEVESEVLVQIVGKLCTHEVSEVLFLCTSMFYHPPMTGRQNHISWLPAAFDMASR